MRRLREQFPDELVVVGVHSAKFPSEQLTRNVRQAVMRLGIEHPVVNDAGFQIWGQYSIRAWPTVVVIDPEGKVVAVEEGEIQLDQMEKLIRDVVSEFRSSIDRTPLKITREQARESLLQFPSKVLLTPNNRLFVADSGHHRIVEIALESDGVRGTVARVFGGPEPGFVDGDPMNAKFHHPRGMSFWRGTLYVADTGNHAVRAIDLGTSQVRTVAGTGEMGRGRLQSGAARETALRSPWAVWCEGDALLVALAGSHQIGLVIDEREIGPFAGNGHEALVDGARAEASFNQPSDLAMGLDYLFVADAEASAIRAISLSGEPVVHTLVGRGLFDFGDVDGEGGDVRLQHPTGMAFHNDILFVADTYNHKVKTLDPTTGRCETLIGSGRSGHLDGPFLQTELYEPEGLSIEGGILYIADTGNHRIRAANLPLRIVSTLEIEDETVS